jgi:hypothetical protein
MIPSSPQPGITWSLLFIRGGVSGREDGQIGVEGTIRIKICGCENVRIIFLLCRSMYTDVQSLIHIMLENMPNNYLFPERLIAAIVRSP